MDCLSLERLYSYLEEDLGEPERIAVEAHLASCPKCRCVFEERKLLLQAAETLPPIEVPPDFAKGIMDRLSPAPAKPNFLRWPAAGFTAFVAALAVVTLLGGDSLSQFFIRLTRGLWGYAQNVVYVLLKIVKYISLSFKILTQIAGQLLEGLKILTSFIGPEMQIAFVCATILIIIGGGLFWSRKFFSEKNNEK